MWEKMETKTIVYDLDTSGGLMEVRVVPSSSPSPSAERGPPPHKAGPELAAQEGQGRGVLSHQTLPPIFAIRGAELSLRGHLQQFHLLAALDLLSRGANPLHLVAPAGLPTPFLSALFVLSPSTSGYRASGLSRAWLWSPPLSIQGSGEQGTAHPLPIPLP